MPEWGMSERDLLSAVERIAAFGEVPVITAEELVWCAVNNIN